MSSMASNISLEVGWLIKKGLGTDPARHIETPAPDLCKAQYNTLKYVNKSNEMK